MSTYDTFAKQLDPTPKVRSVSGPFGEESLKTVAEALAFCEREGLDPNEVRLAHNYCLWEREETPEEVESRIAHTKRIQQDHVERIAEMHADYVERGLL